jgi:hypothetical protein
MLKFEGNRNLKDIKRDVLASGGAWDDSEYKGGSDWIHFIYGGRKYLYSGFNGRFITKDGKKHITEESTEMEKYKWYVSLLNLIYVPKKSRKRATA